MIRIVIQSMGCPTSPGLMSLGSNADTGFCCSDVRFVPIVDILSSALPHYVTNARLAG